MNEERFWAPRLRINRDVTLPTQYRLLEGTGRIDNFRAAMGVNPAEYGRPELDRLSELAHITSSTGHK